MSANVISASGELNQPRGIVKINDEEMPGWISVDVDNNTYYEADTFAASFAIDALPTDRGLNWWSAQTEIFCEVLDGIPADADNFTAPELTSRIYGRVDSVEVDMIGRFIQISGRDLTAKMIDSRTTEKFQNLTASAIAEKFAARHGLTAVVTTTKTRSGRYYEIDHARLNDQSSEWDLLAWLAHEEGFVVFVKGKTLHFEPRPPVDANPYLLQWKAQSDSSPEFNGTSIKMSRNLTVSRGVVVTVNSWHQKTSRRFSESFPKTAKGITAGHSSTSGDSQLYSFTIPNLTPEKALARAKAIYQDIVRHEMKIEVSMSADEILDVTSVIELAGTGTAFDQRYYPDSIRRSLTFDGGYTMEVSAKNHSPESQVGL